VNYDQGVKRDQRIRGVLRGVLFDAAGTLIEPVQPVGETYARIAADFGIKTDAERLQRGFQRCFPLQPKLAFPSSLTVAETTGLEYKWWRQLVWDVLADDAASPQFDHFFDTLYHHFATTDAWRVIEGVGPTLRGLADRGFTLGVVSNFDTRLFNLLRGFGLDDLFAAVVVSSRMGVAKPDPEIFLHASQSLGLPPAEILHVGDSPSEDVVGAVGAGMQAILLDRFNRFADNPDLPDQIDERVSRIDRFDRLAELHFPLS